MGWVLAVVLVTFGCSAGRPDPDAIARSVARLGGTACLRPILAGAVVVGDGRVLTVAHAVAGADADLAIFTSSGLEYPARVVGFDPEGDLALLEVDGLDAPSLPLGSAKAGDVGVIASVSGELELNLIEYRVARIVVAQSGDIYDQGRVERTVLEIEAEVGPGVSGAALVDGDGAIVGIVFAESTESPGAAYALDASEIVAFLEAVDSGEFPAAVAHGRCR